MKTEITLCDVCKDRIGNYKCGICERDMCEDCKDTYTIRTEGTMAFSPNFTLGKVEMCKHCLDKLRKGALSLLNDNEVIKTFITATKNALALHELEKTEEKPEQKNNNSSYTINPPINKNKPYKHPYNIKTYSK